MKSIVTSCERRSAARAASEEERTSCDVRQHELKVKDSSASYEEQHKFQVKKAQHGL